MAVSLGGSKKAPAKSAALAQIDKATEAPVLDKAQKDIKAKVDLIGELEPRVKAADTAHKALKSELDEAKTDLLDLTAPLMQPADGKEFKGEGFKVKYGPKAKVTTVVSNKELFDILGEEQFLKLAKVTIGDIKDYLTKAQQEQVLVEEYAGNRSFKVEALPVKQ